MLKILLIIISLSSISSYAWEPEKPISVIIGFTPGSGNELSFRGISSIIEKQNQNVNFVIENKPGADGVLAMNEFITKPKNGYHLYVPSHQGIWVTADYFNKQAVKYTLEDFEYVLSLAKSPLAVIATSSSSVNTVPELISRFKTTNTPINVAAGSGAHKLAFEYMASKINLDRGLVKTVGYKGPLNAGQDVAGGHVEFGIIPVAVAAQFQKTGKVKIIGICSEQPIYGIDAPLMNRWIPGMNVYAAWAIILPKDTPEPVKNWYVTNFSSAIRSSEAKDFFRKNYMFYDESELTPEGHKRSMMSLRKQWIPILNNLTIEQ